MQKSQDKISIGQMIIRYMKSDRGWTRVHRLHHAEFSFKQAKTAKDAAGMEFWKSVMKANAYDYEDKILNAVRKEAQREAKLREKARE